jgi:uncharacterized protein GlcG (DUF336 family)
MQSQRRATAVPAATVIYQNTVIIPIGSQADVLIPLLGQVVTELTVAEGGVAIWSGGQFVPGVAGVRSGGVDEAGGLRFSVGQGSYAFELSA